MSFTPGIPTTGQSLDQTRDPIRNNFSNYNTVVSQDHVSPNSTGQGKHNKSTYVAQGTPPVSLSGEIVAFSQVAGSGSTEVYIQRDGVATNYQLTGPSSSLNGTLIRGGTTSILGGLMLKWAVVSVGVGTTVFTWASETGSAFSLTPIFYGIVPSGFGGLSASLSISSVTSTNFSVTCNTGGVTAQIIAIGA
jgi:hypothetical protein